LGAAGVFMTLAPLRALWAVAWTAACTPLAVLGALLGMGSPARHAKLTAWAAWFWSKGLLFGFGVRLVTKGALPPRGAFIASNHLSHLDILVLSAAYRTNFVAKSEISKWPVMGWLSKLGATVFIDRANRNDTPRVIQRVADLMTQGVTMTVFVEGYCGDGTQLLEFKRSLFKVPVMCNKPVVPIALYYDSADAPWVGEVSMVAHMFRMMGRWQNTVTVCFGEPIQSNDRRELAVATEAKVNEMFVPSAWEVKQ